jgi:hypothetical protein
MSYEKYMHALPLKGTQVKIILRRLRRQETGKVNLGVFGHDFKSKTGGVQGFDVLVAAGDAWSEYSALEWKLLAILGA